MPALKVYDGCRRCDQLREELSIANERAAQMQARLFSDELARRSGPIRLALGVTRGQARLLMALAQTHGIVSGERLQIAVCGRRALDSDGGVGTLKAQVSRTREVVGSEAIVTHWGNGYSLSDAMRSRLKEILDAESSRGRPGAVADAAADAAEAPDPV